MSQWVLVGEYDLINLYGKRINVCGGDLSIYKETAAGTSEVAYRVISYASEALALEALDDIIKQLK